MEYEESERAPGSDEFDNSELYEGVHIRQEYREIMIYALFDEEEQVSEEYGPLNENEILSIARGYSKGKERYE